jgi:Uma2 family endonuclease
MTAISKFENPISIEQHSVTPKTLPEFLEWEPEDGFKYEWNDGEIIQFNGMDKKQIYIYILINKLFNKKGYGETGTLVCEYNTMLSGIQMRRPDIAYLSDEEGKRANDGEEIIPAFMIEIISTNDNLNKVEEKITEYFKAGVKVIWNILPEQKLVYVYTSRKQVQICMDDDICSATPVLPKFEVKVSEIFG